MGNSNETADWEDLEVRINIYLYNYLKLFSNYHYITLYQFKK